MKWVVKKGSETYVYFIIRPWSRWFGVFENGLDDMGAGEVVGAGCADCVVGAVESYRVVWVAGPG